MKTENEKLDEFYQRIQHQDGQSVSDAMSRRAQRLQLGLLERIANTLDSLEAKFTSVLIDD